MMIGATAKSLASLSVGNKSYGGVLDNLYRLPFVKPESDESESDTLAGEDADFLKYDGVVEQVCFPESKRLSSHIKS